MAPINAAAKMGPITAPAIQALDLLFFFPFLLDEELDEEFGEVPAVVSGAVSAVDTTWAIEIANKVLVESIIHWGINVVTYAHL
jgi:hypothetical protein